MAKKKSDSAEPQPGTVSTDQIKIDRLLTRIANMERSHASEIADLEVHYLVQLSEKGQELRDLTEKLSEYAEVVGDKDPRVND
jgi:hypothetical protein